MAMFDFMGNNKSWNFQVKIRILDNGSHLLSVIS